MLSEQNELKAANKNLKRVALYQQKNLNRQNLFTKTENR